MTKDQVAGIVVSLGLLVVSWKLVSDGVDRRSVILVFLAIPTVALGIATILYMFGFFV